MTDKIKTSIIISKKIKNILDVNNIKLSSWIEDKILEEFSPNEFIEKLEVQLMNIREIKKEYLLNLNQEQIQFFRDTSPKNFESYQEGLLSKFNNLFDFDINMRKFKNLYKEHYIDVEKEPAEEKIE